MITKHWSILVQKNGEPVRLFTSTTDDTVSLDLDGERGQSLIRRARQFHRHAQTPEQNHRDLAIGALMAYAVDPAFDCTRSEIQRIDGVPPGPPSGFIGGGRHADLVPVWEEAEEDFGLEMEHP